MMWRLMLDETSNLLSIEAFTERLNQAAAAGIITDWERERVQAMHEWHRSRPEAAPGGFGFGRGDRFGNGRGRRGKRWVGRSVVASRAKKLKNNL